MQRLPHVLMVEDDEDHAHLMTLAIQESDSSSRITHLADGLAAMKMFEKLAAGRSPDWPDVILLDLKLPGYDGHELLATRTHHEPLMEIPVVVLTTSANAMDCRKAYELKVNSYVVKPVDFDRFHDMVSDVHRYWCGWNLAPKA